MMMMMMTTKMRWLPWLTAVLLAREIASFVATWVTHAASIHDKVPSHGVRLALTHEVSLNFQIEIRRCCLLLQLLLLLLLLTYLFLNAWVELAERLYCLPHTLHFDCFLFPCFFPLKIHRNFLENSDYGARNLTCFHSGVCALGTIDPSSVTIALQISRIVKIFLDIFVTQEFRSDLHVDTWAWNFKCCSSTSTSTPRICQLVRPTNNPRITSPTNHPQMSLLATTNYHVVSHTPHQIPSRELIQYCLLVARMQWLFWRQWQCPKSLCCYHRCCCY